MVAVPPLSDSTNSSDSLRKPPYSLEAEQAVLGGLLLDANAWDNISGVLTKFDFYTNTHKHIFEAIESLTQRDQPLDVITVQDFLKASVPVSEHSKIVSYLVQLASETPSAANISAYANIVHRDSMRRKLISVSTKIIEDAYKNQAESAEALIDDAEKEIFGLSQNKESKADFVLLKDLSAEAYKQIEERAKDGNDISGLATGFTVLDEKTNGLQKSDLIIVAGRPGMGKTSLALNIAEYAGIRKKKPVAIFSLEMPKIQLVKRFYSSYGKIDHNNLRNSVNLTDEEWSRLSEIHQNFWQSPIYIDDSSTLTPTQVRSRVRRLKREEKDLALVVVDYLQLMTVEGSSENRATEIAKISRSLKALAKEIDVPIIALSQLNRNPESRPNQKPQMSDLRESGAIEQDADIVAMIYRDDNKESESDAKKYGNKIVTLEIVKHRNGPTFHCTLTFIGKHTRFENYFPEQTVPTTHPSQKTEYFD